MVMARTAQAATDDTRVKRPRPGVSKRKLTLTEAADQWVKAKRTIEREKPLLEEAAAVLLEHFDRTGRSTYRDQIALTRSTRLIMDQAKVREFLGAKLKDFQKRVESRSLSLLN